MCYSPQQQFDDFGIRLGIVYIEYFSEFNKMHHIFVGSLVVYCRKVWQNAFEFHSIAFTHPIEVNSLFIYPLCVVFCVLWAHVTLFQVLIKSLLCASVLAFLNLLLCSLFLINFDRSQRVKADPSFEF